MDGGAGQPARNSGPEYIRARFWFISTILHVGHRDCQGIQSVYYQPLLKLRYSPRFLTSPKLACTGLAKHRYSKPDMLSVKCCICVSICILSVYVYMTEHAVHADALVGYGTRFWAYTCINA